MKKEERDGNRYECRQGGKNENREKKERGGRIFLYCIAMQ